MIKVILIDDEPLARGLLKEYFELSADFKVVAECNDGFEGAKAILQWRPDLILLDVQMPKINGFEMLELLDDQPAVIFTTAFDAYAINAFENHAVDYLLKPISKPRFDQAIAKYIGGHRIQSKDIVQKIQEELAPEKNAYWERILVKVRTTIKVIPVDHIHFLKADDDYVQIHTPEGSFMKKETMAQCEQHMDPQNFVRVHRSYLVNIHQIDRLEPFEKENYVALLKSGARVHVSKNGYGKLKQVLGM